MSIFPMKNRQAPSYLILSKCVCVRIVEMKTLYIYIMVLKCILITEIKGILFTLKKIKTVVLMFKSQYLAEILSYK
jgi:hypothetical protein